MRLRVKESLKGSSGTFPRTSVSGLIAFLKWCHLIPFSKKASTPRVGGGEKSLRKSFRLDFCRVCPPPPYWLMRLFTFGSG